jgi:UDP-N-acetylmuramoylalanine-D-glutamate ligase
MENKVLGYELDQLETLHRKDGILYAQKAYRWKRDLLMTLLDTLDRSIILISVGRHLTTVENMEHPSLKAIIRVKGNEINALLNWTDGLETFRYVTSTMEKAILLANELAQRGDVVLFSPYGNTPEIMDWYAIYAKNLKKVLA